MTPGQLRLELSKRLGRVYSDRVQIIALVEGHAPEVGVETLPFEGNAFTTWNFVLSELVKQQAQQRIKDLIEELATRDKKLDRARFEALVERPRDTEVDGTSPNAPEWVRVELDVRWSDEKGDVRDTTRISTRHGLLHAVVIQEWEGRRPPAPSLVVMTSRVFAQTQTTNPTLRELSVEDGVAMWSARIPFDTGTFRTHKIVVRCVDSEARAPRHVIPLAGWLFAAGLWLLCGVLMLRRVSPLIPTVFFPLAAVHMAQGGWSLVGAPLLQVRGRRAWLQEWLSVWERVLPVAVILIAFAVVIPRAIVVVANTTKSHIELADRTNWLGPEAREIRFHFPWASWTPPSLGLPFCACNRDANCKCADADDEDSNQFSFGCIGRDCDHITRLVENAGGSATLRVPLGDTPGSITFEPGALVDGLSVVGSDVSVSDVKQKGPFALAILPNGQEFTLRFPGMGALACQGSARRVARFTIDRGGASPRSMTITAGGTTSTWTWSNYSTELRACVGGEPVAMAHTFQLGDFKLECQGAGFNRIASISVSPPAKQLVAIHDTVRTLWSSTDEKGAAQAALCTTSSAGASIEFGRLAEGQQLTLPSGLQLTRAGFRKNPQDAEAVWTPCHDGATLRMIKLSSVEGIKFPVTLGSTTLARLDNSLGFTCGPNDKVKHGNKTCTLSASKFSCRTPSYSGPCTRFKDQTIKPGSNAGTALCSTAPAATAKQIRVDAGNPDNLPDRVSLDCTEVFLCDFH